MDIVIKLFGGLFCIAIAWSLAYLAFSLFEQSRGMDK